VGVQVFNNIGQLRGPIEIGVAAAGTLIALILLDSGGSPATIVTNGRFGEIRERGVVVVVRIPQRQVGSTLERRSHNFSPLRFRSVNTNSGARILQSVDNIIEEFLVSTLGGPIRRLLFNIEPNGAVEAGALQMRPQLLGLRDTRSTLGPGEHVDIDGVHAGVDSIINIGGALRIPGARTSPSTNDGVLITRINETSKARSRASVRQIDTLAVPCAATTVAIATTIARRINDTALNGGCSWAVSSVVLATNTIHLGRILADTRATHARPEGGSNSRRRFGSPVFATVGLVLFTAMVTMFTTFVTMFTSQHRDCEQNQYDKDEFHVSQ